MDGFSIPQHPEEINARTILIRLIDSVKFRYQMAMLDIKKDDFSFKINQDGKSMGDLLHHIYKLQLMVLSALHPDHLYPMQAPDENVNEDIVLILNSIRLKLLNLKSDQDLSLITVQSLSFWNLINGPITDSISHIGQINLIRRAIGKPAPKVSMLKGIYLKEGLQ